VLAKYFRFYLISIIILISDQLTKFWISNQSGLKFGSYWPNGGIEIIPKFFYLAYAGNSGAAWGILSGFNTGLILFAIVALVIIFILRNQIGLKDSAVQWPLGLLSGGVVGNLFDRILHGYVIDFIDIRIFGFHWPAFNLADSGITIGVIYYLLLSHVRKPLGLQ
tara:strand:- start:9902 stop:10396 length:495 start_codon:yes stop_codon:yes gene_type:complete